MPADTLERTTASTLRKLIVPVYLPIIIGAMGGAMLIPVLPLYLADLGLSVGSISLVLAGAGIGTSVGSVPVGEALGRWGERVTLFGAFALLVLATAPLGITDVVIVLLGMRILAGVASSAVRLTGQTFVTRRIATGQRGRAISFIGGSYRVAFLFGPAVGGLLADVIGFTMTFVVAALTAAIGFGPAWWSERTGLVVLAEVESAERSRKGAGMVDGVKRHWRRLALCSPVIVLVMAAREGRFIVLPLIADDLGLTATQVGALITVSTAADLALFPIAGWVMDRFGRLYAIVPAFSLLIIGLVILASAGASTGVIIAAVIMGVGNGIGSGTMMTLGSDLAPADSAGPFLAGMGVMQGVGRIVGPFIVGTVASMFGLGGATLALAIVLGIALAWMVAVIGESSDPTRIRSSGLR